jgi:hypothetical protein
MKPIVAAALLSILAPVTTVADGDAFAGTWKVDPAKSTAIIGQLAKQELLIIEVVNGAEHATNDIIGPDGVRRKSGYTATYNDGKWYETENLDTHKPVGGMVMMVRADPQTELRIGKNAAGKFTGVIMRQVSDDGKSMTITWSQPDGRIGQVLKLDKQ